MKVNELFNDEYKENYNYFNVATTQLYYSNKGYFLRKSMELDDFRNEVVVRMFKYWNYDNFRNDLNTYIGLFIESTLQNIYQSMDRDKNKLNYDDTLERFDKPIQEDEKGIYIPVHDDYLEEHQCINYILEGINNNKDYDIIKLYLHGYKLTEIAKHLNLSFRLVQYRIKNKYSNMMKQRFYEYVNSK